MSEETRPAAGGTDPLYLAKAASRGVRARGGSAEEALQRLLDANADVAEQLALFRDEARAALREHQAGFRELQTGLAAAVGEFKGAAYDELERLRREREDHQEHARGMQAAARDLRTEGLGFFQASMAQWTRHLWALLALGGLVVGAGVGASRYLAGVRAAELEEHQALRQQLDGQQKDLSALKKRLGIQ